MQELLNNWFIVRQYKLPLFFVFAPYAEMLELVRLKNIEETALHEIKLSIKDYAILSQEIEFGLNVSLSENDPNAIVSENNNIRILRSFQ
jgi:hypothetical protein